MKNIFKQIISDFHMTDVKKGNKRDIEIPINTGKIISVIGPRRSGKSYLLFNIINYLTSSGIDKTNIVYINFEDERINISGENLQIIIDAYLELYNDKKLNNIYFFFDEIQNIFGWEKFIRRIYDTISQNIFITGSNAKLLSKEISTSLRGRSLSFEVLPLSFKEFLEFSGFTDINIYSSLGKANIINLQKEYITWGGFPEIISFKKDLKIKTLQEYFDVMLYNDIIERYKIKDVSLLKNFVKSLLQTTTKEYSINKIGNQLKSLGFKFDKNSLYDFLEYLDTIYFGKSVSKFDHALSKQTLKKFYLFDNGFLNAISFNFSDNYGKLLENTVFIELYRKYSENIFFLKNGNETDFVINNKENYIYQVCYDLNIDNYDREINGCITAMNKFNVLKSYLITFEQEKDIKIDGKTIKVIPYYKWVLEN
ncbi:MAG: ATP-binding protein [Candidatus Gracilibacteria bacterium]|nr:ATP-binding protein [Candidatus Gracilibacteria bacterium]